jgi:membrane peptidoglycan carboxypeptidase
LPIPWSPTPTKLSSWKSITSQFSDIPPGAGSNYGTWEFEYDIWLNGLADNRSTEVMIWTYNDGRTPAGSRPVHHAARLQTRATPMTCTVHHLHINILPSSTAATTFRVMSTCSISSTT